MKRIGKNDLIAQWQEKSKLSTRELRFLFDELFKNIRNHVKDGNQVGIANFATITPKEQDPMDVRNPRTNKMMSVQAKNSVGMSVSGNFKKYLNDEIEL